MWEFQKGLDLQMTGLLGPPSPSEELLNGHKNMGHGFRRSKPPGARICVEKGFRLKHYGQRSGPKAQGLDLEVGV